MAKTQKTLMSQETVRRAFSQTDSKCLHLKEELNWVSSRDDYPSRGKSRGMGMEGLMLPHSRGDVTGAVCKPLPPADSGAIFRPPPGPDYSFNVTHMFLLAPVTSASDWFHSWQGCWHNSLGWKCTFDFSARGERWRTSNYDRWFCCFPMVWRWITAQIQYI